MSVLVAPDKFKGSLTAKQVAEALADGLSERGVETTLLPLADGGDGSVKAALSAGFRSHRVTVRNALRQPHVTEIAFDGHTALIEVANSCGLQTVSAAPLQPPRASSAGFGDALKAALALRPRRLVLALGGSASTDGGAGMLEALGVRFLDADGRQLEPDGARLSAVTHVDATELADLSQIEILVVSDVQNPLTGPGGAAAVYGPQKGATPHVVAELEAGLRHLVEVLTGSGFPQAARLAATLGAGAAGGLGLATLVLGGQLVSGADFFLDLLGFEAHLAGCDVVITGEGRIDDQTAQGKLPAVVARRSRDRTVIAVVGRNDLTAAGHEAMGLAAVHAVLDHTDADAASNPALTATILRQIGRSLLLPGRRSPA